MKNPCLFSFFEGEIPTIKVTDVIGLPPTRENIPELHTALNELDQMIGLGAVKKTVEQMVDLASSNYERELAAEPIDLIPLNRLFLGNPGTGKVFFIFILVSLLMCEKKIQQ